jgi:hypothetical protein
MAVQVQVTWTVVGDDELEITSEFGHLDPVDGHVEDEAVPSFDQVLEPESSLLASGLALELT